MQDGHRGWLHLLSSCATGCWYLLPLHPPGWLRDAMPGPAAAKTGLCCPITYGPSVVQHFTAEQGWNSKQPTPSIRATSNSSPCPGFRNVKAKGEGGSYGRRTAAQQKGSGSSTAKPSGVFCSRWQPPCSILCYCPLTHS